MKSLFEVLQKKCEECLQYIILYKKDNQEICLCYPEYLQTVIDNNSYAIFKNNIKCVICNEEYYYTKRGELDCYCAFFNDT